MKHMASLIGFLVFIVIAASWMPARVASSQETDHETSVLVANPLYVAKNGSDANDCLAPATPCATINAAIGKATPGDTVYVAEGTYTGEGDQVVWIDKDIILSGGWDPQFTLQRGKSVIDGEKERVVILVNGETSSTLEKLIIQSGFAERGAGILNSGNLSIVDSTISGNTSSQQGGGIQNWHGGKVILTSSTVSNNQAKDNYGGGIFNEGPMTISNCVISHNSALLGGGGISSSGAITITGSTLNDNTSNDGAGLMNWTGQRTVINNSTISGNHGTSRGGGIFNMGIANLNNVTIYNNEAIVPNVNNCTGGICEGGGINSYGTATIQNTIIAGNRAARMLDCAYTIFSSGYNLIGDTTGCNFQKTSKDLIDVNPQLWPTLTGSPGYHQLLKSSPAIDAGNPNGCTDHEGNPLNTDQRGVARLGRCDIGAYEYNPEFDPLRYISLPMALQNHTLCSDFFDDFSNPSSGWHTSEDDETRFAYRDGEYSILVKSASSTWLVRAPTCSRVNYSVEADMRWAGESGDSYGIVFGLVGDFEQYYSFRVNSDNQLFGVSRITGESFEWIVPVTFSSAIHPGKETNHLKITRNGTAITLEVNETVLGTWNDSTILEASDTGLIVRSYSDVENAEARFDNFTVSGFGGALESSISTARVNLDILGRPTAFELKANMVP